MKSQIEKPYPAAEPSTEKPQNKPLSAAETVVLTVKVLLGMAAIGGALWLLTRLANLING